MSDISTLACNVADEKHTPGKLTQGMCAKHYQRARKYGPPYGQKETREPSKVIQKICTVCSTGYASSSARSKYCSQTCKDKGKPSASGLTCCVCSGPMVKGRSSKPQGEAAHNKCRTDSTRSGAHGVSGYRRGCRCEVCREGQRNSVREYVAMVKARDGVSPTQKARPRKSIGKTCHTCGEEMKWYGGGDKPTHKTCTKPSKRKVGLLHERFQKKIDKAERGTNGGNRVFASGPCAWCGANFTSANGVYCTDRCKVQARFKRRSRGFSFNISPIDRQAIYMRDSWTCQLCMHPVDKNLKHPNRWSATLDHIEPQSATLIPDHSPSNLRLTHMWCNAARGDGSNMAEEELVSRATSHLKAVA